MRSVGRGWARGKYLLLWITLAVLVGSAAIVYRVYDSNQPLTTISAGPTESRFSAPVNGAGAAPPVASLADALNLLRADLERDPNAPVLGNPDGDVTIVEFFDYNCPYCKRIAADVKQLIAEDPGIRVVYREWPILGSGSEFAARAALAARRQGKYEEMHWALMALPRVTDNLTLQAARTIGLDVPRLLADMDHRGVARHIQLSMDLARSLGINGTPTFIIGDQVARGLIPPDDMRDYVREARAAARRAE